MAPTPALKIFNLSKTFSGERALHRVDLTLQPGEIRALVGQNGCGKSTMIKVLAGYHQPDPGAEVEVGGKRLAFGVAGAGDDAGIRFVHQDLGLVPTLNAMDSIAMSHGYELNHAGLISWRREARLTHQDLTDLGYDIDVRLPTSHLVVSERTAIALARALSQRATPPRVLILDEPTANLSASEVERLFEVVRTVRDRGVAVIFVSHHLNEVFAICETVTVLRDGRHIVTRPVEGLDEETLITLMIGRKLQQSDAPIEMPEHSDSSILRVRDMRSDVLRGIDFDLRPGEIIGIAGITGSGREEVALALFGGVPRSGVVQVGDATLEPYRPDHAVEVGLGLVPADRHANAAFLDSTLRENVSVVSPGDFTRRGLINRRSEVSEVTAWLERLRVRPLLPNQMLAALSGGNQQKVMLARWMRQKPKVLVLDEPTQGVDIGAKADIHALIEEAAREGAAVIVVSTDHIELTRLAERVLVLRGGRVGIELCRPNVDPDRITAATIGGAGQGAAA